ncbi:hypothetical protein [Dinoroseobacter sp. S76]|uniref:hypothetical protein n=1 Tax=Dinoroseobacter sp. S76 TaxID=3415124 RepID=UPI003C797AFB
MRLKNAAATLLIAIALATPGSSSASDVSHAAKRFAVGGAQTLALGVVTGGMGTVARELFLPRSLGEGSYIEAPVDDGWRFYDQQNNRSVSNGGGKIHNPLEPRVFEDLK